MEDNPSHENYFNLRKAVLWRLVMFNKRHGGEVSRITLEDFCARPKWSAKKTDDIYKGLCPLEQELQFFLFNQSNWRKRTSCPYFVATRQLRK